MGAPPGGGGALGAPAGAFGADGDAPPGGRLAAGVPNTVLLAGLGIVGLDTGGGSLGAPLLPEVGGATPPMIVLAGADGGAGVEVIPSGGSEICVRSSSDSSSSSALGLMGA
jgi:hypothetical protein